jgi:hypothetical protein
MTDYTLADLVSKDQSITADNLNTAIANAISSAVSTTLQKIYPVGAFYISESATNPATLFGFGTWELLTDRTLIGAGSTYSVGVQGGEATHTLTVAEMPSHYHETALFSNPDYTKYRVFGTGRALNKVVSNPSSYSEYYLTDSNETAEGNEQSALTNTNGSGSAHNNLPPYRAVYIFRRTA